MRLGRRALLAALAAPVIACGPSRVVVGDRPARIEPTPARAAAVPARQTAAAASRQTAAAASRGTEAPPTPLADDGALQRQLDRFLDEQRGQFGVAVRDLHGPVAAAYRPRERFPLGSLFKLLLMYEVMRQVRLGAFPLAE